jgi:tripartite-type tricarboxylate transporter receptor subunit TctC
MSFPGLALSQEYPVKPVRIVVPYPPGGVFDAVLRPLAVRLGDALGQPVVIDNRPGANTIIGMDFCAKAPPDGYTICATANDSMSLNPHLYAKLPYDTDRDFAAVAMLLHIDQVIVSHPSVPANTFTELVAVAKARPDSLNFSSFGQGSSSHMILAWLNNRAGMNITHVPYKGGGPAVAAVLSGEAQVTYMGIGALLPHVKAGRVKALAVPQTERSPFLPDTPTLAELGLGLPLRPWIGVVAPAQTPRPIVNRLSNEIVKVVEHPAFREEVLVKQGFAPAGVPADAFAAFMREDRANGAVLVKLSGIRLEY